MFLNIELYHSNFDSMICPNCHKVLNKISKRKFICPDCKNDIYYRKSPEDNSELLLSSEEKELFEYYKTAYHNFNSRSKIKTMLLNEMIPKTPLMDEMPINDLASKYIPVIIKKSSNHLKKKDLGLYTNSLHALGYLYAVNHNYEASFNCFAFRTFLMVNGVKNNMETLDLNLLPLDNTYMYIDHSDLVYSFFLKCPYLPFDFNNFYDHFISIFINPQIVYRYSLHETYLMIYKLLRKYI